MQRSPSPLAVERNAKPCQIVQPLSVRKVKNSHRCRHQSQFILISIDSEWFLYDPNARSRLSFLYRRLRKKGPITTCTRKKWGDSQRFAKCPHLSKLQCQQHLRTFTFFRGDRLRNSRTVVDTCKIEFATWKTGDTDCGRQCLRTRCIVRTVPGARLAP